MDRSFLRLTAAGALFVVTLAGSLRLPAAEPDARGVEFFEKKIRPVLVEHCYACHSLEAQKAKKLRGGLLLDSKAGLLKGGESGPVIVAGKPAESRLMKALRHEDDLKMPPRAKLPDAVIAPFAIWITMGTPVPADSTTVARDQTIDWNQARQFWAFQMPVKHPQPKVQDTRWARKDIDAFVLAEMEKRGLKPVRPASKQEWLRRATFDLIGLPPTPEEMAAFLRDESAEAYARVVDRLLGSPHYGERWGRYWLDVARYADDKALAIAKPFPYAFRYRDWVIQAFNQDMPYDRFLRLQLAGDLLPEPGADPFQRLAGLGFQGLGAEYHKGNFAAQVMADELDDRIDTLSRGLLGLTVACARCHDHKFDPIPTRDYYSLAAAYQGASMSELPLAAPEVVARYKAWEAEVKNQENHLAQWLQERGRALGKPPLADVGRYLLTAYRLRILRERKMPQDEVSLANQEKLQPFFLKRVVKYLEPDPKTKLPAEVQIWQGAADRAVALAKRAEAGTKTDIPEELQRLTDSLQRTVRAALQEQDRLERDYQEALTRADPKDKGKVKKAVLDANQEALLKALWLTPRMPFFVDGKEAADLLQGVDRQEHDALKAKLELHKQASPPAPLLVHGVQGGGQPMRIHIRGRVENLGDDAPPGFLGIVRPANAVAVPPARFTRLELANAIASAQNPLTVRVFVNRVWQHHFGRGIVGTPSNFGKLGDRPTHPELLDTLAVRFMEAGWSVKWLHREIMLSSAYQLSSANDAANAVRDADNHFFWRMSPSRLDVEAWRDALLAVSGRLDATVGGPSLELNNPKKDAPRNVRRTIYALVSRSVPDTLLTTFDFPDANVSSDHRSVTTVPQQQLFALNSAFMSDTARAFAARLARATPDDDRRLTLAFALAYGRPPTAAEKKLGLEFLRAAAEGGSQDKLTPWEQYAQALLAANEFIWID